ncbi:hypothetical protein AWB81_07584 [Caballeronia arationis]|nr:hypothetical protein AWB81_07584 [Caballeronia arationis]
MSLAAACCSRIAWRLPILRRATPGIAGAITLLLIAYQPLALRVNRQLVYEQNVGGLAVRAHVYDANVTRPIYPFEERLIETAKSAETAGISIFAPKQRDYFKAPARIEVTSKCLGYVDHVSQTKTPGVVGASGWIYDASSRSVPNAIVIAGPDGKVLGTGLTGGRRDDVSKLYGSASRYADWTAFFSAQPDTRFDIDGQTNDGAFCSIGGSRVPVGP